MALEYRATRSETAVRYYTCSYCGAKAEVAFHAVGDSGWHRDRLLSNDAEQRAHDAAEEDMMTDADRVLHLIRCPTCKRRHGGYVRWSYARVLFWFAACGLVFAYGGLTLWIGLVLTCGAGLFQGYWESRRFKRADTAILARVQQGTLPEPKPLPPPRKQLAPPPDLPPARAITAPPIHVAPIEPRGPDEEPAFLHEKK